MGNVVQIHAAAASSGGAADFISAAYEALRTKAGLRVRGQQEQLSRAVFESLTKGKPLLAEAPTGTGKTIGYLVGALAAQSVTGIPVVAATATVALQEQLLTGDLPRLVKAGILGRHELSVAKGRGRYLCIKAAEKMSEGLTSQLDIFDEQANVSTEVAVGLDEMVTAFRNETWDGDVDRWTQKHPVFWAKVQANADTCTKTKCDAYDRCAFFKARASLFNAKVVVANHDLVLADLSMAASEVEPVLPLERYALIVDEAHHLPDKAMEHGRGECGFTSVQKVLLAVPTWLESVRKHPLAERALEQNVDLHVLEGTGGVLSTLGKVANTLATLDRQGSEGGPVHVFPAGELPEDLRVQALGLVEQLRAVEERLADALRCLRSERLAEKLGSAAATLLPMQVSGGSLHSVIRDAVEGLAQFCDARVPVKWVAFSQEGSKTVASPLDGDSVLTRLLWKPTTSRAQAVMVSATLRDFDGFERFAARAGVPEDRIELVIPAVLPYENATLELPFMRFTPRQVERMGYEKELCDKLPAAIDTSAGGALVLASSWKMLERVRGALVQRFGNAVLVQGTKSVRQLVAEHRERVDAGKPSILLGVASLAEGLDLPGHYCTHVLICAIPFASPVDPVEQERARVAGKEYFNKHSLPDALVKLVQMTGRLIRREDDAGRITVYDMRLRSSAFGRRMLSALPSYRQTAEAPSAQDRAWLQAKARKAA